MVLQGYVSRPILGIGCLSLLYLLAAESADNDLQVEMQNHPASAGIPNHITGFTHRTLDRHHHRKVS